MEYSSSTYSLSDFDFHTETCLYENLDQQSAQFNGQKVTTVNPNLFLSQDTTVTRHDNTVLQDRHKTRSEASAQIEILIDPNYDEFFRDLNDIHASKASDGPLTLHNNKEQLSPPTRSEPTLKHHHPDLLTKNIDSADHCSESNFIRVPNERSITKKPRIENIETSDQSSSGTNEEILSKTPQSVIYTLPIVTTGRPVSPAKTKKSFTCPECNKTFRKEFYFLRHIQDKQHGVRCDNIDCKKVFENYQDMNEHISQDHLGGAPC